MTNSAAPVAGDAHFSSPRAPHQPPHLAPPLSAAETETSLPMSSPAPRASGLVALSTASNISAARNPSGVGAAVSGPIAVTTPSPGVATTGTAPTAVAVNFDAPRSATAAHGGRPNFGVAPTACPALTAAVGSPIGDAGVLVLPVAGAAAMPSVSTGQGCRVSNGTVQPSVPLNDGAPGAAPDTSSASQSPVCLLGVPIASGSRRRSTETDLSQGRKKKKGPSISDELCKRIENASCDDIELAPEDQPVKISRTGKISRLLSVAGVQSLIIPNHSLIRLVANLGIGSGRNKSKEDLCNMLVAYKINKTANANLGRLGMQSQNDTRMKLGDWFRIVNLLFHPQMKERFSRIGQQPTKDELTAGKTAHQDFSEDAVEMYNSRGDEQLDEMQHESEHYDSENPDPSDFVIKTWKELKDKCKEMESQYTKAFINNIVSQGERQVEIQQQKLLLEQQVVVEQERERAQRQLVLVMGQIHEIRKEVRELNSDDDADEIAELTSDLKFLKKRKAELKKAIESPPDFSTLQKNVDKRAANEPCDKTMDGNA